ncbi:MAG: hypothetical protein ACPL7L_05280 [bacterium]
MITKTHLGENQISEIADSWLSLQHHPNSDLEHFLLVCRLRKEVISPWAFSVWRDGQIQAIVAGRIEEIVSRPRIGYLKLPGLRLKCLTIIHEGILGELDREGGEALVYALHSMLKRGEVEMVSFHHLQEKHTALWEALKSYSGPSIGISDPNWSIHRALSISGSSCVDSIPVKDTTSKTNWLSSYL